MQRGRFIALEGIDGSGTTSQAEALAARLRARGHRVTRTHEPSEGSIGRLVRQRLGRTAAPLDPAAMALLFAADRIDHVRTCIEPALSRGEVVLTDRYLLSSWVYQSLECDGAWVREINRHAPWPDRTFVLDLRVEVALDRVHARANGGPTEIYESASLQETVRAGYLAAVAEGLDGVCCIDAERPLAEITDDIFERCLELGL
jgi:dTMP kinase